MKTDIILSGVGGQVDFIYGASRSEGGKAIIAMPSVTKNGISKIANTYFRTNRAVFWHIGKIRHLLKQRIHKEIYNSTLFRNDSPKNIHGQVIAS